MFLLYGIFLLRKYYIQGDLDLCNWLQSVILAISFHYQLAPLIIAIRAKAKSLQYVSKIFLDLPTTYINRGLDVHIYPTYSNVCFQVENVQKPY